ncbi:MAG: hypothetical protein ACM35G_03690, partial [Planctomycetaceae bacterium]
RIAELIQSEFLYQKIVDCSLTLENMGYGYSPWKVDRKSPGSLLFATPSGYAGYTLTECHSSRRYLS